MPTHKKCVMQAYVDLLRGKMDELIQQGEEITPARMGWWQPPGSGVLLHFEMYGTQIDLACVQVRGSVQNDGTVEEHTLKQLDRFTQNSFKKHLDNIFVKRTVEGVGALDHFYGLAVFIKYWSKRRGLNGKPYGLFSSFALTIMAASVARDNPKQPATVLVRRFFQTFSDWPAEKACAPSADHDVMPSASCSTNVCIC